MSVKFSKFKQIPVVPSTVGSALKNFLTPVKQILEVYQGNIGDKEVDKVVRLGDLTKAFLNKILGSTTTAEEESTGTWTTDSDTLQIAIIGDSLSQAHAFRDTWAWQLKRLTDQMGLAIIVKNWAVSGDTFQLSHTDHTEHCSGTRSQVEQAVADGADIVFVALGINDALAVGGQTAQEIIDDAYSVFTELRDGLPDAKLIYVEEAPHDIDTLGLSPAAMTNDQCIPWSHGLITYLGKSNCRVNNATYEGTASAKLTEHQTWGTATTGIRTIFDDFFTVNVWKMSRMGCRIDLTGHLDTFGHMIFAHTVLKWLKDNNDVNNQVLNIDLWSNVNDKYLIDSDELYDLVIARDARASAIGRYNGIDIFAMAEGWFYGQAQFKPNIGPAKLVNALWPVIVAMENCEPSRPIWLSWNDANFMDPDKTTTAYGDFHHVWVGPEVVPGYDWTSGTKNLAYAVELTDGTFDVYTVPIILTGSPTLSHARARRDSTQSIPDSTSTVVVFNVEEHDTLAEYNTANGRFTATSPGYYSVHGGCHSASVAWAAGEYWTVSIHKNGSYVATGDVDRADAAITTHRYSYVTSTVYLNGSTDYIDLRVIHNQGAAVNVRGINPELRFNYINIDRLTM